MVRRLGGRCSCRRWRCASQPWELLVLRALLALLAVLSLPCWFPTLYYDYIPAERLSDYLLTRGWRVGSPPLCPAASTLPADVPVDLSPASDAQVAALETGPPANCSARHRVAVIVPYRARAAHLRVLLRHLHPFLRAQWLDYRIYVIEQTPRFPFNRGKLLNIGATEAGREFRPDCLILHDVDLLPENLGNVYACTARPRHLSVRVSSLRYLLPYASLSGGVLAVTPAALRRVNGYSNLFFGWGGEDDDLSARLAAADLRLVRPDPRVTAYTMLPHEKEPPNAARMELLRETVQRAAADGLSSLQYTVLAREGSGAYRRIRVEV